MKKVMLPTDFSSCANNALDFAIQSAKIIPLEINIIHIFQESDDLYLSTKKALEDKLDLLKLSILQAEDITVKTKVIRGEIIESIMSEVSLENIDMIIMGSFGVKGVMEKLWGSRTSIAIRHSPKPVLVIPYDYEWKMPEKILLATNHFEEEPALLDFLFELSDSYKAEIQVAVFTDEEYDRNDTVITPANYIVHYEQTLKERYPDAAIEASQVSSRDFPDDLEKYLRNKKIDLLVMITYQKNFVERIFHPSMTRKMSYLTTVPLLAIPARQTNNGL